MKIYQIGYKPVPYGFWGTEPYLPLQVGSGTTFLPLRDNTGDNISEWNPILSENTGIYWVWKNTKSDITGVCQYRRRIKVPEGAFNTYDAVVCHPAKLLPSMSQQYSYFHSAKDMEIIGKIIGEYFPEYLTDWVEVSGGHKLYYSNCFVLKRPLFDNYCGFLFGVLFKYLEERGWDTVQKAKDGVFEDIVKKERQSVRGVDYQCLLGGFMSERLFTCWLHSQKKNIKILETDMLLMENTLI